MDVARKNVAVLALCQGLLLINNAVLVTVNALAGYALAADKALACGLRRSGGDRHRLPPESGAAVSADFRVQFIKTARPPETGCFAFVFKSKVALPERSL